MPISRWLSLPVVTRTAIASGALLLAYFATSAVSMANFGVNTPIWFANALAVAWLLQLNGRAWPWLIGLIYVADALAIVTFGSGPAPALALADVVEIFFTASLLRRFGGAEAALMTAGGLARLTVICLTVPIVSAAWGAGVLALTVGDQFIVGFVTWYAASALGLLVVCPMLLIWFTPALRGGAASADGRTLTLLLAGVVAVAIFVTGLDAPAFLFAIFPALLLVAWRGGLLGVSLASALLVGICLWRTLAQSGAIAAIVYPSTDILAQIQALQIYLAALTLSSLPLAVVLTDQRRLLLEMARLADARSEFLAAMSHEIRTPMTGVLGMVDLLDADHPTESQRRYLDNIRASGRHLLGVINDVLDFTRIETGRIELERIDFSLPALLEQVQSVLHALAAERGIKLAVGLTDRSPPVVRGDPARVKQILLNLVGNAIKFTPEGSVLVIAAHCPTEPGHRFRFEVRDTGIGISDDKLLHIFSAFTQADNSTSRRYGGSGLGLAISKRLVDAMGGEIGVESKLGEGSLFWFEIPFEPGDAINMLVASPANAAPIEPRRLLLAEDVELNRDIIRTVLERDGHKVIVVENGREALELVQREAFDLILMDVHMPVMDGLDATRAIRALPGSAATTPIVALTANVMASEQEKCRKVGMDAVLMKPMEWEQVRAAIRLYGGQDSASEEPSLKPSLKDKSQSGAFMQPDAVVSPILSKLAQLDEMTPGLGRRVGTLFLEDSRMRLVELALALANGDADAVAGIAHAVRGSAAIIGAEAMASASARIEEIGRAGDLASAQSSFDDLSAALEEARVRLSSAVVRNAA